MLSPLWFRALVSGESRGVSASMLRGLLAAGEVGYRAIISRKNAGYDSGRTKPTRVAAPVISVGNLTVGGTGKTPLVCWLAQWFEGHGVEVVLLSRGYGAKAGLPNDEALELAARLPGVLHLQNPDRVAGAHAALKQYQGADAPRWRMSDAPNPLAPSPVLILDDAFQHRRISRDLDIVLLDALEPFGFGRLLPRGLLREPVESLARADVIALSRADAITEEARVALRNRVMHLAPSALWLELLHQPSSLISATQQQRDLSALRGKRVAAFCGIGNPAGFRHTLATCGLEVAALQEFPDHFAYDEKSLQALDIWAQRQMNVQAVVCTRKDLVKIPRTELGGLPLWALEVELNIVRGQFALEEKLCSVLLNAEHGRG